jgi:hypothetical protein
VSEGIVRLNSWAGITRHLCRVVGHTRTRYRVEFYERVTLPGARVAEAGVPVLVPRTAVEIIEGQAR